MLNQKLGRYLNPCDFDLWVIPSAILNSSVVKSLHCFRDFPFLFVLSSHLLHCILLGYLEYYSRTLYVFSRWDIFNNHWLLACFLVKCLKMEGCTLVVKVASFTQSLFFLTSLFCFDCPLIDRFSLHCQARMFGLDVNRFCFNIFCFFCYCFFFQVTEDLDFFSYAFDFFLIFTLHIGFLLILTLFFCSFWPRLSLGLTSNLVWSGSHKINAFCI